MVSLDRACKLSVGPRTGQSEHMFPNDIICMKDFFLPSRHIDILNHIVFSKLHCFMPTVYEGVVETICDFMPE